MTMSDSWAAMMGVEQEEQGMLPLTDEYGSAIAPTETEAMRRTVPDVDPARAALVAQWGACITHARNFYKPTFDRMREEMDFARGKQWPHMIGAKADAALDSENGRWDDPAYYVANITHRHITTRVASLYAKNPKSQVKLKQRLLSAVWDGGAAQLQAAQMMMQQAMQTGQMPPPEAAVVVQEAQQVMQLKKDATLTARTLEILLDYYTGEQATPFKASMKALVKRAITVGVGYVKVGFQRQMETRPDVDARINDASTRLATIERLSAELADGERQEGDAEAEQLRLAIEALRAEQTVVKREGLVYEFPRSTSLLIDPRCQQLKNFVGADWVAQEYAMTPEEVMEVYGIDPRGGGFATYGGAGAQYQAGAVTKVTNGDGSDEDGRQVNGEQPARCMVYEIFSRKDGLVYHYLEGYPDFLREPAAPAIFLERFWPWFVLAFNEVEHHSDIFPPSDVALIRDQQMEMNRSKQGLREHRKAARPKMVTGAGQLEDDDREALQHHPTDGVALIELKGLSPNQKIEDLLQVLKVPAVDPNMYDPKPYFEDVLRVVGSQEANMGPAGGDNTATESAIAESSRMSSLASSVDELDDLLTEMSRSSAQILLGEMGEQQVKEIVGPGAMWPQMTREQIAAEISVVVQAGSTGRPNKAVRINEFKSIAPFLMQMPGVNPEKLLGYQLQLLDDTLEISDFMSPGLPSIATLNSAKPQAPTGAPPDKEPANQGGPQQGQGAQAPQGGAQPHEAGPEGGSVPNIPAAQTHGMARRFLS
jgi:hypothetical protein